MAETDGNISTQSANADRPDSPQYARAILDMVHRKRSRALRRLAEENSNPLYAWEALLDAVTLTRVFSQESRKDFARPLEKTAVPNWVLWHLTNVADQLLAQAQGRDPRKRRSPLQPGDIPGRGEAEISAADACRRLSATMGLSRRNTALAPLLKTPPSSEISWSPTAFLPRKDRPRSGSILGCMTPVTCGRYWQKEPIVTNERRVKPKGQFLPITLPCVRN
jgi:hypothetical protein